MTFERLIASRFLQRNKSNFSRPLVNIAIVTIALGLTVMIMAVCILRGFKNEITGKIVGFGSHITVRSYGWVNDYDEIPIIMSGTEVATLSSLQGVSHIQAYAYKGGMLKTSDQIQGIIFKGVDCRFDSSFFVDNMVRGRFFNSADSNVSSDVIISQRLSEKLKLDTGDKARVYFWAGNNYKARAFRVAGIYNTDLSEFDDHYILGDIRQVQRLNGWDSGQVAGYELIVDDFSHLEATAELVKENTRPDLAVTTIVEDQPSLFAWLNLLNSNIALILVIMAVVCAASVVSALLIMIFEKTSMIGILKTMGSTDRSIRRIFMIKAMTIVGEGIVIGNAISLLLCLIQSRFHLIKLDSESYSMTFVPVDIEPSYFILLSIGTLLICLAALLLPSSYIARIHPAKTIRFQ